MKYDENVEDHEHNEHTIIESNTQSFKNSRTYNDNTIPS